MEEATKQHKVSLPKGNEVSWVFVNDAEGAMWVAPVLNTYFDTGVVRSIMGPNGRPAGAQVELSPIVLDKFMQRFSKEEMVARMEMGIGKQLVALGVPLAVAVQPDPQGS